MHVSKIIFQVEERSEMYSLGMVLLELLVCKPACFMNPQTRQISYPLAEVWQYTKLQDAKI